MWGLPVALWVEGNLPVPEPPREFRAAWVATVDNIDWPSAPGLPIASQRAELLKVIEGADRLGLNALVFQIRTSCDAMYPSSLEPSSWFLTGAQGADIGWDPLEFAIQECHARCIELHAWLNPYRAGHPAQQGDFDPSHVSFVSPKIVYNYSKFRWLDPGSTEAETRTLAVVRDVLKRYDVDGIHIDDYFYPYPAGGRAFPDAATYAAYIADGGRLGQDDWRRDNVNRLVRAIHGQVKSSKPWVRFGVSPFGIYRPGVPSGIKAGVDQYAELYADVTYWLEQGWCDYMAPQLYWKSASKGQPFGKLLAWWKEQTPASVDLVVGLFTSQCDPAQGDWPSQEIASQVKQSRKAKASGTVHFSAKALLRDWNGVGKAVGALHHQPAVLPLNVRGKGSAPAPPALVSSRVEGKAWKIVWKPGGRGWTVWRALRGQTWGPWHLDAIDQLELDLGVAAVSAQSIDRFGRVGAPNLLTRPKGD